MLEAAELAGFIASYALEQVSKGDQMCVFYAYLDEQGECVVTRIKQGLHTKNVTIGQNQFIENPEKRSQVALIYAYPKHLYEHCVDHTEGRIVIEFADFSQFEEHFVITLPYVGLGDGDNCKIFQIVGNYVPQSVSWQESVDVISSFVAGIGQYEPGSAIFEHAKVEMEYVTEDEVLFQMNIGWGSGQILAANVSLAPQKYDSAAWHYGEGLPDGYEENALCVHIGAFLAWCILNGLGSEKSEQHLDVLQKLRQDCALLPGRWCLEALDGNFWDEDLNEEGNQFAAEYYDSSGQYGEDFFSILDDSGVQEDFIFTVPDTWESYETVAAIIDKRYADWKISGEIS